MKNKILHSLTGFLLILSTTALLRADRDADRRNEIIPTGHEMHPPLHKLIVPFASSGPTGYTPQQMRHAYGFDQLGATGAGQIIAIVDAYGSSTIQADLNTFCAAFGLASTTVAVYYPGGKPGANSGWATETSLDVEWAHAIAPDAKIALVVAHSSSTPDLLAAVDYAVSIGAKQVSMSWGGSEYSTEATTDFHFKVSGVTFFASSGDGGAGTEYPSSSPFVVGVGGTTLHLNSSNDITSETAWSGSGGGASLYEPAPSYQAGWSTGSKRGVPDVAYDANPSTGVPVYLTGPGWAQYGGTSMSAPQWAALFALANSLRSESISSAPGVLYSLASANFAGYYHDITSGSSGHPAGPGYDLVTGLGTPIGNQIVPALGGTSAQVAAPVFTPGGGTFTSAQIVAISTTTPHASIRYTTDGSTPSETVGTIYSGPVSVTLSTTLKAIAYEIGFTDSLVTSETYTISTGGGGTFNFEAASMSPVGTGATVSTSSDANVTGGLLEFLNSTAVGQFMTLTTPSLPAGTYQVQFRYKTNTSRAQHNVKIDGTQVGGTIDQYAKTSSYPTATLGTVIFAATGTHTIVLTVTGKDSAATHFYISADKFTFVGQ